MIFVRQGVAATWRYWRAASIGPTILFISGSLLFVSLIVHGLALVVSGGSIQGPVSFRKAMTFAETGWLLCWSVGWLLPLIRLRRWQQVLLVASTLLFGLGETALFSLQVWRGVPSHYNTATPFDAALFATTGVFAAIAFVGMLVLMRATLRPHPELAPSILLSVRAGTALVLVGMGIGIMMIVNSGGIWEGSAHATHLFAHGFDAQPAGMVGGDLVMLHAIGVHGLNLIPLVAWLLTYSHTSERMRTRLTTLASGSIIVLMALLGVQVFRAQPFSALSPLLSGLISMALIAFIAVYGGVAWLALRGLRRSSAARHAGA